MNPQDISCVDARSVVRSTLSEVCSALQPTQARRLLEDALLVVSELTANALLHAGGVTRLTSRVTGGRLILEVSDGSRAIPTNRQPERGEPGGYGWGVIHRLCARVHVEADEGGGKTISAALALP